jgi:hypothetical protein
MVMRRMRREAWSQLGDVHLDWVATMRTAIKNRTSLVQPVGPNGQIIKVIGLGGESGSLGSCHTRHGKGWEQNTKISA